MSTSTPHYPSTAELSAFRRSLMAFHGAPSLLLPPPIGGAWRDEREHGIGYRVSEPDPCDKRDSPTPHRFALVRREASYLRSRAALRIFGDGVTWPEQTTYAPEPYGEDTLSCDVCGHFECAADLTPDWNGETGAHLSCER